MVLVDRNSQKNCASSTKVLYYISSNRSITAAILVKVGEECGG